MEQNCKSHSCDDPEHKHQFPEMKNMKKNLEEQMQKCSDDSMYGDKPDVSKALRAATVAGMGREARFTLRAAAIAERPVRHLGESVSPVVHVTPRDEQRGPSATYESCGGCGIIHKSMQPCPRCALADTLVEVKDWRS